MTAMLLLGLLRTFPTRLTSRLQEEAGEQSSALAIAAEASTQIIPLKNAAHTAMRRPKKRPRYRSDIAASLDEVLPRISTI